MTHPTYPSKEVPDEMVQKFIDNGWIEPVNLEYIKEYLDIPEPKKRGRPAKDR